MIRSIEINPIELCNRSCSFCPRSAGYPNSNYVMSLDTAERINFRLIEYEYDQIISICGFGEPLLHKNLSDMVKVLTNGLSTKKVSIITNGDKLSRDVAENLSDAGVTHFNISMYDEDHEEYFKKMLEGYEVDCRHYYTKPTNEVNRIQIYQSSTNISLNRGCNIPSYKLFLDWDGSGYLCSNDWNKSISNGNVYTHSIEEMWNSDVMNTYREMLKNSRSMSPCSSCNVDGLLKDPNDE